MFTKKIKTKIKRISKKIKFFLFDFQAFTLLELIIVIAILSILGLIVFYSVTGFIKQARDTSRYENLNRINLGIDLFALEKGFYPEPDFSKSITYSGGLLWKQGNFGEDNFRSIGVLSSKPVDLISQNDFTYSLANDKKQYELGAILESDELMLNNFLSNTYARSKIPVRSMVVGNYNGLTLNVATGGLEYILTLPTILSYDINETDIVKLIDKKTLAYKGHGNIGASYTGTLFKIDGGFDFEPNILVLYAGTYDNLINNESEWINLLNNIQESYSSTILDGNPELDEIMDVVIDLDNPSKETRELSYDVVHEYLNIDLPIELTSGPNWLTYDISNSLLDGDTRSITQDSALNMWFATKNGVSTFIGNTWGLYDESDGLVNKDVRDVLEANNGDMWFATNKGVSIFDGTNWYDYDSKDGLIDDDVVDILQDSLGNFWFATKKGVGMFDGTNWLKYKETNGISNKIVTGISESLGGDIWISTIDGVSVFDGTNWTSYNESEGLIDKNVSSVYTDNNGFIWFGTINGISKFNGTDWISYNEGDGLIDKNINNIYQDNDGNMWFATMAGASKFDQINTWVNYTIADGLADNDVQVIYQDDDLNIWFGTKKGVTIFFN